MKKKGTWKLVVGILFVLGSLSLFGDGSGDGFIGLAIGALLIGWWYLQNKEAEAVAKEAAEKEADEPETYDDYITAKPTVFPNEVDGLKRRYQYNSIEVYAPYHCMKDIDLNDVAESPMLEVVQEPTNEHGSNAVGLKWNGKIIAYLYRGEKQDMANDFLNRSEIILAAFKEGLEDERSFYISMAFYK